MSQSVVGLDVGGANLKAAHTGGASTTSPFALWKQPDRLPAALSDLLARLPPARCLALTMTGELCDCYASKREGVLAILDAVQQAAPGKPVLVWALDQQFVYFAGARQAPLRVAAANWLALAHWVGRFVPGETAVLLDIGSTTTDLIPLADGVPCPVALTDPERLASGELVYTGVRRTPVCAVLGPDGAAELFATMQDVYLVLGELPENADDVDTADGRPATRENAHRRLARMRCADLETSAPEERLELAGLAARKQTRALLDAFRKVVGRLSPPPRTVVLSGSGEFLGQLVLQVQQAAPVERVLSLGQMLGPAGSEAACAHAVAVLALDWLATRQ